MPLELEIKAKKTTFLQADRSKGLHWASPEDFHINEVQLEGEEPI